MTVDLIHLGCNARCEFLGDPENPPDPDRWGNLRTPHRCVACGERTTVVHGPHGGSMPEVGFRFEDDIEWAVPL